MTDARGNCGSGSFISPAGIIRNHLPEETVRWGHIHALLLRHVTPHVCIHWVASSVWSPDYIWWNRQRSPWTFQSRGNHAWNQPQTLQTFIPLNSLLIEPNTQGRQARGHSSERSGGISFFLTLFGLKWRVSCADLLMKRECEMEGMSEEHIFFSFFEELSGKWGNLWERGLSKLYLDVRSNYL